MRELLAATTNLGKFREISKAFEGLSLKLVSIADVSGAAGATGAMGASGVIGADFSGVVEDGETFEENALKKAKFYFEKTGIMTLAEDAGVIVFALPGELGVKTRRWGLGEKALDKDWGEFFLRRMKGEEDRRAKFVCCACLVGEIDGKYFEKFFVGETKGVITENMQAPLLPGLPLSSCFKPDGYKKVYAAMSLAEKNEASHRGKAMRKVVEWMKNLV